MIKKKLQAGEHYLLNKSCKFDMTVLQAAKELQIKQQNVFTHMHYLQVGKRDVKILIHICKPHQSHICNNECAEIALLDVKTNYM